MKTLMESSISEIDKFLSKCFFEAYQLPELEQGYGYVDSYPHVFQSSLKEKFFGLRSQEDGALLSFCSLYIVTWVLGQGKMLKGACIGSVATRKEYRHQGLGQKVLKLAEDAALKIGCQFSFVFSPDNTFYRRNHYRPAGQEVLFLLGPSRPAYPHECGGNGKFSFRDLHTLQEPQLREIWSFLNKFSHSSESLLSFEDFLHITKIPQMKMVEFSDKGELEALAFFGKGLDFSGVYHGLCGVSIKAINILIDYISSENPGRGWALVIGPWRSLINLNWQADVTSLVLCKALPANDQGREQEDVGSLFDQGAIYPRTLQSA